MVCKLAGSGLGDCLLIDVEVLGYYCWFRADYLRALVRMCVVMCEVGEIGVVLWLSLWVVWVEIVGGRWNRCWEEYLGDLHKRSTLYMLVQTVYLPGTCIPMHVARVSLSWSRFD